jgi:hypothetical protein
MHVHMDAHTMGVGADLRRKKRNGTRKGMTVRDSPHVHKLQNVPTDVNKDSRRISNI